MCWKIIDKNFTEGLNLNLARKKSSMFAKFADPSLRTKILYVIIWRIFTSRFMHLFTRAGYLMWMPRKLSNFWVRYSKLIYFMVPRKNYLDKVSLSADFKFGLKICQFILQICHFSSLEMTRLIKAVRNNEFSFLYVF